MKTGLALEGGGMLGLYEAGVLDVMMERGLHVDVICGTSAGAVVGMNMVSEQPDRARRTNIRYAHDKRYVSLRSWLTTGNMVNADFAYHTIPAMLDPIDCERFAESTTQFYVTVTNVGTGEAEYKHITDPIGEADLIRASASLPFLSRQVEWQCQRYLDGGLADNIPYALCEREGCERTIVVLTHPAGYVKRDHITRLCERWYPDDKALIATVRGRNTSYRHLLQRLNEKEARGEMFVFRPSRDLHVRKLEKSRLKLEALYRLGRRDAERRWTELEAYLNKTE